MTKDKGIANKGQDPNVWAEWWADLTPESEIKKWDYYGLRPWILKFTPRHGKVIEAGCGLGRWDFYLSKFGVDIDGLDFFKPLIEYLNDWRKDKGFDLSFVEGDVTQLPYEDESLSGYLSFGVVEHFIEGPQKPIAEAYRVLRPGGVAVITTPAKSWLIQYRELKTALKNVVKKIIGRKIVKPEFFQYEYKPRQLKKYVADSGLKVTAYSGADLLFTFNALGNYSGENIQKNTFGYWFSNAFEKTFLRNLGAQAITISVKVADEMYCFISGEKTAKPDSLKKFMVPISEKYQDTPIAQLYRKGKKASYAEPYQMNIPTKKPTEEKCTYCENTFMSDELFENYGLNRIVCSNCIKVPEINLELANKNLVPIWRQRPNITS